MGLEETYNCTKSIKGDRVRRNVQLHFKGVAINVKEAINIIVDVFMGYDQSGWSPKVVPSNGGTLDVGVTLDSTKLLFWATWFCHLKNNLVVNMKVKGYLQSVSNGVSLDWTQWWVNYYGFNECMSELSFLMGFSIFWDPKEFICRWLIFTLMICARPILCEFHTS